MTIKTGIATISVHDQDDALKFYPLATAELDPEGHIRHVSHRSITAAAEQAAVAAVKAVRDAIGPKIDLMLDMSAELVIRGRGERGGHATTGRQGET